MSEPTKYIMNLGFTHLVVDETHGAADSLYRAYTVDRVGAGYGDSVEESVLSFAESLREMADKIEQKYFGDKQ